MLFHPREGLRVSVLGIVWTRNPFQCTLTPVAAFLLFSFFLFTFINFAVGTSSNLHDFPLLTLVVYFPAPGSDCNCRLGFSASCFDSWNSLRSISETSVLHLVSCSLETQTSKDSKDNRL